jgi:hypothetical protein
MAEDLVTLERVGERFLWFAAHETATSPLYNRFCQEIAADPEVLAIAAHTRQGQPTPNMLFGAVHYLLLKDPSHALAAFYPDLSGSATSEDNPYPAFRDFCLDYRAEIEGMLKTRLVQTNEVRRCACLLPAFGLAGQLAGDKGLALIEIGTSAGLNLLWDRYGYDYGPAGRYGDPTSSVQLVCEVRGEKRPPFPAQMPQIVSRLGLDLNPLDLTNPEDVLWLRALVWPEHRTRAELLGKAIEVAQATPPPVQAGDALDLLPQAIAAAPRAATLGLYHGFALNQFSPEMRERLKALIIEHSWQREIAVISFEWRPQGYQTLGLTHYSKGTFTEQILGQCEAHGGWIEWLA